MSPKIYMGPWLSWKVHLTEKEKQKLQVWARVMPFREPLAWATVALFDANITGGVGGFSSSPSSPLPPGLLGSALMEASLDSDGRLIADAKAECASVPVLVDVPSLHRIKENYTEEMLQVSFCDVSSVLRFVLYTLGIPFLVKLLCRTLPQFPAFDIDLVFMAL